MFRPASKGLDNALVECDLTKILAEGSGGRWGQLITILPPVYVSSHMSSTLDQGTWKWVEARIHLPNLTQKFLIFSIVLILGATNSTFHVNRLA